METKSFASAIYQGKVRHRRFVAANQNNFNNDGSADNHLIREFSYSVFMVYLDLQELDAVFEQTPLWSKKGFSLAWLRRQDYLDGKTNSLYQAVSDLVATHTGRQPTGPIRMLSNLRLFGFIINPISCYYCFDAAGEKVETIVAEVTNTPWGQRCCYILPVDANTDETSVHKHRLNFDKAMHVSPFQAADMNYHWVSQTPNEDLFLHIDVNQSKAQTKSGSSVDLERGNKVLDATMTLKRHEMNAKNMNHFLLRYPWMTLKVFVGIYWQAVKLWFRRQQYYPNVTKSKFSAVANK